MGIAGRRLGGTAFEIGGERSGESERWFEPPPNDRRRGVEAAEAELRERRIEIDAERDEECSL